MKVSDFFRETVGGKLSTSRLAGFLIVIGFMVDWMSHIFMRLTLAIPDALTTMGEIKIFIENLEFHPDWAIVTLIASVLGIKEIGKVFGKDQQ